MANDVLFSEWLNEQIRREQWTQGDLAKAAGLRPSTINKMLNSKTKRPSLGSCEALATAFRMSTITILRAAKWLPAEPKFPERDDLNMIVGQLPDLKRKEMLVIARVMLEFERKDYASVR